MNQHYCRGTKYGIIRLLDDYQLVFQRVATIVPRPRAKVPVTIWEIDEECEEALDIYEGYPQLYRKIKKLLSTAKR